MYRGLLASVLAICAASFAVPSHAIQLYASSLTTNSDPDANAAWFDIDLNLNGDGTATYIVANLVAAGNATKISDIYFGTDCGSGGSGFCSIFRQNLVSLSYNGAMSYTINWSPGGGSQILNNGGWGVEVLADATTGNNSSVINPGESLAVTFTLVSAATTEADLIAAFLSDPKVLGIAFHVQSIAGGYSEWYEANPEPNEVPEPGTLGMLGAGLLGLGMIRRRRAF